MLYKKLELMVIERLGDKDYKSQVKIKELLLDVLKPHRPNIVELSKAIADVNGVKKVTIDIVEIDQDTESVKIQITGDDINLNNLIKKIREMGASVHSIDSVTTETY